MQKRGNIAWEVGQLDYCSSVWDPHTMTLINSPYKDLLPRCAPKLGLHVLVNYLTRSTGPRFAHVVTVSKLNSRVA